jgi:hypothetical protein
MSGIPYLVGPVVVVIAVASFSASTDRALQVCIIN